MLPSVIVSYLRYNKAAADYLPWHHLHLFSFRTQRMAENQWLVKTRFLVISDTHGLETLPKSYLQPGYRCYYSLRGFDDRI